MECLAQVTWLVSREPGRNLHLEGLDCGDYPNLVTHSISSVLQTPPSTSHGTRMPLRTGLSEQMPPSCPLSALIPSQALQSERGAF